MREKCGGAFLADGRTFRLAVRFIFDYFRKRSVRKHTVPIILNNLDHQTQLYTTNVYYVVVVGALNITIVVLFSQLRLDRIKLPKSETIASSCTRASTLKLTTFGLITRHYSAESLPLISRLPDDNSATLSLQIYR